MTRDKIRERARFWASPGEWRPTASHLVDFFVGAKTEQFPTLQLAEKTLRELDVGCYLTSTAIRHWCGIFACYVLREAGLDVQWTLNGGRIIHAKNATGQIRYVQGNQGIQPGDVAIIAAAQHHFIVMSVNYDTNVLTTVEGNTKGQYIRERSRYITGGGTESPYGYYQILA